MKLSFVVTRMRRFAIALGLMAVLSAGLSALFIHEQDAIIVEAVADSQRIVMQLGEEIGNQFRQAVDLVASVDEAQLMRLDRNEAARTFLAMAQGPVQRTQLLNSLYIGFPNGEFWQHREQPGSFLASATLDGQIAERGYRRLISETPSGLKATWYYYSGPRADWVAVQEPNSDYDPRTRPWYDLALRGRNMVWTAPYKSASSNDYSITLAHRLDGRDTTPWGIVAIDFMISPMNSILAHWRGSRLPASADLRIIDGSGNIVAFAPDMAAGNSIDRKLVDFVRNSSLAQAGSPASDQTEINGKSYALFASPLGRNLNAPLIVAAAIPIDAMIRAQTAELKVKIAIILCAFAALAGVIFYLLRMRRVSRDFAAIENITQRIADGDLGLSVEGTERQDDFGRLSRSIEVLRRNSLQQRNMQLKERELASHLTALAHRIAGSVEAIRSAASEISHGSDDLAARTEHQSSALQETAASMSDISTTVVANASSSEQAQKLAADALARAESGGKAVGSVIAAMASIENSSTKITNIIQVMEEISFQTKLLALNAAVEAARAGESGKGFAVVAQEVRFLADRSRQASQQIRDLIAESTREVSDGVRLAGGAGDALTSIIEIVRKVAEIAPEIAAGSREQAHSIGEINRVIADLDAATQQNAALAEESSAAAASLASQSLELVNAVNEFRETEQKSGTQ